MILSVVLHDRVPPGCAVAERGLGGTCQKGGGRARLRAVAAALRPALDGRVALVAIAEVVGGTQRGFAMTLRCTARRARALGTRLMIVVSVLPRTPLALTSSRCLGWSGRPLRRLILQLFAPLLWSQGGRPEGWPRREARMGPLSMKGITVQELAWICRFFVGDPILLVGVPALPVL